jgi:hypothetical protein
MVIFNKISSMFRLIAVLFFLVPVAAAGQTPGLKWFRGNIHTHSLWSDGNDFPEMIMDWYKSRGYDFIALSDHNTFAEGEKWVEVPAHPFRQRRFREYVEKYGASWVVQKTDTAGKIRVKLKTLAEYKPLFEEKDKFLLMQAEEITDKYGKKPVHIGAVNNRELVPPQGGNSVTEVMQRNLDAVANQRRTTGQPMIAHINHPNFLRGITLEDMLPLEGERFFEVYNGHPLVFNYGDSAMMSMEELWDRLLVHYIREGRALLYGLATDDAHDYLEYRVGASNPGRGWIMVRAAALNPAALIDAMESGDFYSTTGVELADLDFRNNRLELAVKPQPGVNYTIQFWGARKKGKNRSGQLLKEVKGTRAGFNLKGKYLYVRAKVISDKLKENPFAVGDLETAWTQPVKR